MFKTLIGTFLLTSSIGFQKPIEKKLNAQMTVRGAYTLRDEFIYDDMADIEDFYGVNWQDLVLDIEHDSNSPRSVLVGGVVNGYFNYYEIGFLDIHANADNSWYFGFYDYDSQFYIVAPSVNDETTIDGLIDYSYDNDSTIVENFILYFTEDYYLNNGSAIVFNIFFTSVGNKYVHNYNSWYNFTRDTVGNLGFTVLGNFVVQNNYYDTFSSSVDVVQFYIQRTDFVNGTYYYDDVKRMQNGTYYNLGNIQINAMLPKSVIDQLNYVGTFQFINNLPETTFYEMIMAVMDAPIKYLTSLFSFQLFGIDMFVAFSSMITLLVVVVIIRKVI